MTDISKTITPRSDQLNSDDFVGHGPITIKVTKVSLMSSREQPIAISYEGDENKPYKPCLSMRRVLVQLWGPDGSAYIGRSMTLYRDEKVKFGGADVGGIRISHLSHIAEPVTLALTASKAVRKPYIVKPLKVTQESAEQAKAAPPVVRAAQASGEAVEYISVDAQTLFEDMLKVRPDLKERLLNLAGCISLARMPAEKYTKAMEWLTTKMEGGTK